MRRPLRLALATLSSAGLSACGAGDAPGQDRAAGPSLFVTAPRMDAVLEPPRKKDKETQKEVEPAVWLVDVMLDLRDYRVGHPEKKSGGAGYVEGSGQHVHVILDDEPYLAIYDVSKPVTLEVKSTGTHVVRAFPSAGPADAKGAKWHESRKNAGAFAWTRFHVKEKGGPLADFDGKRPLLTYSRPKGEYKLGGPDAALEFPLLVDFYLTNVSLEPRGHRVRMTFDGKDPQVYTEWKPFTLAAEPAPGDHTVLLELIDRDDHVVEGPFNRTERKIKVTGSK